MKNRDNAERLMELLAQRHGRSFHVVLSRDEDDIPGNDFHVCDDAELDTFFLGCDVLVSLEV